jgi:hypothetical protein
MYVISQLKTKGQKIGKLAALGVESAQKVIKQYQFHFACPGDPGGQVFLIEAYEEFEKDYNQYHKEPAHGGCWFCCRDDKQEDMTFDTEFDTNVHLSCLRKVIEKDAYHPEAMHMTYLLTEPVGESNESN